MGELRRRTWEVGGWFIFLDLIGVKDFWPTVALGFSEFVAGTNAWH